MEKEALSGEETRNEEEDDAFYSAAWMLHTAFAYRQVAIVMVRQIAVFSQQQRKFPLRLSLNSENERARCFSRFCLLSHLAGR